METEGKILLARLFAKWVHFKQQIDPTFVPTQLNLEGWLQNNGYPRIFVYDVWRFYETPEYVQELGV